MSDSAIVLAGWAAICALGVLMVWAMIVRPEQLRRRRFELWTCALADLLERSGALTGGDIYRAIGAPRGYGYSEIQEHLLAARYSVHSRVHGRLVCVAQRDPDGQATWALEEAS